MATRSYDERIEELRKKQMQLKKREQQLRKEHTETERKKRTKRLIELGAIVESVLGRDTDEEDKKRLMNFLKKQEINGKYFSKAMNASVAQMEESAKQ